jgi:hypothetical protein
MTSTTRSPQLLACALALFVALLAGACSDDEGDADGGDGAEDPLAAPSTTYTDPASWLCRPDVEGDACDVDLDATLVAADGTQTVEPFEPAVDPGVDCFYVYPTISTDPGDNSDLVPDDAEISIVAGQAARFAEACNVYAPMYRQVPLGALFDNLSSRSEQPADETTTTLDPDDTTAPRNIAYADVREAFGHYLAEDNDGRPFVLIGHSQGAGHLGRLVGDEIDGNDELRGRMLSAMLIGTSITADGKAAFENVPPCGSPEDTGCVVSYASFYAGEPPPEDSLFGRPRDGEGRAVCSNPGDLGGNGMAPLQSYFTAGHAEGAPEVSTPWVHYDGLVEGECVADEEFDWLELTNTAAEGSPLPPDLGGRITPQWGTHLADMNFALGDLVALVRSQAAAD